MEYMLAGCLAFNYESPHTGEASFTTNTDDAKCVRWFDLTDEVRVGSNSGNRDRYGYTVTGNEGIASRIVATTTNMQYFDISEILSLEVIAAQDTGLGAGEFPKNVLVEFKQGNDVVVIYMGSHHYDYPLRNGTMESSAPNSEDFEPLGDGLESLYQRMQDILDGESYIRPQLCRFNQVDDARTGSTS